MVSEEFYGQRWRGIGFRLGLALLGAGSALWTQQPGMTARDMFYSAAGLVAPAKAAPAASKSAKTAGPSAAPVSRKKTAPRPTEEAKGRAPAAAPGPGPGAAPAPTRRPALEQPGPQVVLASQSSSPLGLRYSILKQVDGRPVEVDADTVFRSGDRIRLTVMSNDRAYLYIIQRGSSGNWSRLFPSPEINGGNNVIEPEQTYEIPAGHWFAFDEQTGKERVFIVLSRKPEPNLESMIYSLREGEEQPRPAQGKVLLAQDRPIDDTLVQRVRAQVFARDLVFEKVDEKTPGEKKEKAVYVVNKAAGQDSRVVADVTLVHQ